ncbi:MAG: Asp-tRNA(Asn)/Glu-tRNA(Gln) amidotransferase subunit GatA [Candidatus Pacebacteria bacterium]|nr:Asp-tRNA(Asn)/Glu-tRNA(Gln) amidotransferase subunit GatA [Candidatus Paceibacterota bacterium]
MLHKPIKDILWYQELLKNNMLNQLTLKQTLDQLDQKTVSLTDLYVDIKQAILNQDKKLNLYLSLNETVLKNPQKKKQKPLAGAPIAVKDNFCTQDMRTSAASKVLNNFVPSYESTVTKKLQQAGGVIIGKTNMDAWAHGSSTETSDFGRTLNPRNSDYLPGGSSGGSAAVVAADACIAAIGSETAGSIRQPASWCGCVGLKPTYGRVSRFGVIAMASSTDSPGPITKTVEDAAILLNHLAGKDPYDATTSAQPVPDYTQALNQPLKDLKIGVLYLDIEGLEKIKTQFKDQLQVFSDLGAKVEPAQALDPHYAIGVYTVIQRGEVSSNLARFDGIRYGHDRSHFGDEAKRRIMLGTFTLSKGYADQYYNLAQKVRTLFLQNFAKLFTKYDVLVSPTSPGFAKKVGVTQGAVMFGELEDMLLEPSSIAGLPGLSLPCYRNPKTNLYLGMNIVAPMWQEELIIKVADAFEKNTPWNSWRNHHEK